MRTPCQADPEKWYSIDAEERAQAMGDCLDCPAIEACRKLAEANDEQWGVWAGVDRSPTPVVRHFGSCAVCGARFQHARVGRRGKFCSQECYHASRAVTTPPKVCEWCGSEFHRGALSSLQWERRRFCSPTCAAKSNGAARSAQAEARRRAAA